MTILRYGSRGEKVKEIQKQLKILGYYKGSIDGDFGNNTKAAVKAFQKDNKLVVDGICGEKTYNKLFNITTTTVTTVSTKDIIVEKGSRGDEVTKIQQQLKTLGYLSDKVDGVFGNNTKEAVEAFQSTAKLNVTGKCDKTTYEQLFAPNAPKCSKKPGSTCEPAHGTAIKMDWFTSGIQKIFAKNTIATITDVKTGISWHEIRKGGSYHADCQPYTAADTAAMKKACKSWSWARRAIFVTINGVNYAASMNCMPHGSNSMKYNNFPGHHCIHFTNSRVHCSNKVCANHKRAIETAAKTTLP